VIGLSNTALTEVKGIEYVVKSEDLGIASIGGLLKTVLELQRYVKYQRRFIPP
jgi:hypothetical protein